MASSSYVVSGQRPAVSRITVFSHALAFVLGFATVFTLIGSAAGLIGRNLNQFLPTVQAIGAILLVIFALVTLGVFRFLVNWLSKNTDINTNPAAAALVSVLEFFNTLLYTERRVTEMHDVNRSFGLASSFLLGVSFSAGWVPCVGPILGSIFFLAQETATAGQGAMLLLVYSLGLGIPFLITGAAFSSATSLLRKMNRYANIVSIISGLFLLFVAALLWTNSLSWLSGQFIFMSDWAIELEDWLGRVTGTNGDILSLSGMTAAPLAFLAGIISFVSPCVLPLVPAYIGFLSSAAVAKRD